MGHRLVDGGGAFTEMMCMGTGDAVEGHAVGGWRSTAAQAGPLMEAV